MSAISGINIGSLLSSLGSSSSGIDVASAVSEALAALSLPQKQWQAEQQTLATQTTGINQIQTDVAALQLSLDALRDPVGALTSMTALSSDTSVVFASAAPGTASGSHVVIVNNIASSASAYSTVPVASGSTTLTPGSFILTVGSGTSAKATTITIGSGVNTLDDVASSINTQQLGVTASVVNDSTGSRLAIVSNTTGSADGFAISASTGMTFKQTSTGEDASLSFDGIPIDSASNTVTGTVAGLTLNLVGAAVGGQVTIAVAPDSASVSQAIASFVGAYNTAIGDVNAQYTVGASGQEGPLGGDSTVQMLQTALLAAGSYSGGGTGVSTLGGLGITMNDDGTLSLNTTTLNTAIQSNFAAVQTFMQGTSSNGFASSLNTQLNALSDPLSGAFTVDLQSISSENKDLQDHINDFQSYLDAQRVLLTAQYNAVDITLQQLPKLQQQINAELGYQPTTSTP